MLKMIRDVELSPFVFLVFYVPCMYVCVVILCISVCFCQLLEHPLADLSDWPKVTQVHGRNSWLNDYVEESVTHILDNTKQHTSLEAQLHYHLYFVEFSPT